MIKAILWDLGNVLVSFEERSEVLRRIVRRYGGSENSVERLFGAGSGEYLYHDIDIGTMSHRDLWLQVCSLGNINPQHLTFPIFSSLYLWHLQPIQPVVEFAKKLFRNYTCFAVSNGDVGSRYVVEMLATHYNLTFPGAAISSEWKIKKPELIQVVAEELSFNMRIYPNECLFIDDVAAYVDAARANGMIGIKHNSTQEPLERLVQKLAGVGVQV